MSSLSVPERAGRQLASTSRVWGAPCCSSSAENFFIMIRPSREVSRFHGRVIPKRRLTTAGGLVLSIIGKKKSALQFLRGRPLVLARVDRLRSLTQSWTGFVRKILHHVVFSRTYLMRLCLKRGQSATKKWHRFTIARRVCIGYEARRIHFYQRGPASSSHLWHRTGSSLFLMR